MDIDKLLGVIPAKVVHELPAVIDKYQINTPLRLAHFLAQCAHESSGFTKVYEDLRYKPQRIMQIWPKRFPDLLSTKGYAFNPEALANKAYAGVCGNGTEKSGDGWKYRGRGYMMLTLKCNYQAFATYAKLPSILVNPELVS